MSMMKTLFGQILFQFNDICVDLPPHYFMFYFLMTLNHSKCNEECLTMIDNKKYLLVQMSYNSFG